MPGALVPREKPRQMSLSVVVPLYNEEDSIGPMHAALKGALEGLGTPYEIVFVDDGSRDGTLPKARELAAADSTVRVIRFRRNYGQTPAMAAGIDEARGDIIVTMDGDLQNDPRDVGELIDHLGHGYDIAVGWRFNRQDKLWTRKVPSRIANRIIGKITGVPIQDNGCSLKAFRATVIKNVPLYSDMHRFIPAMASLAGARVIEVKVRHHARQFGKSKYGLNRVYKVLVDLLAIKTIVSFASRPLLWFALLAAPGVLVSVVCLAASLQTLLAPGGAISVPLAGTGLLFGALAIFLLANGALAELVYKTGDIDLTAMARLTMNIEHE
jgi:glycosyltransferase involved in cell wall biosynthesis